MKNLKKDLTHYNSHLVLKGISTIWDIDLFGNDVQIIQTCVACGCDHIHRFTGCLSFEYKSESEIIKLLLHSDPIAGYELFFVDVDEIGTIALQLNPGFQCTC